MSIARKVKVNYSIEGLERACMKLGLHVLRNISSASIAGAAYLPEQETIDLGIIENGKILIGIKKLSEGECQIFIDDYESAAPKLMSNIITEYIKDKVYPYYTIEQVTQNRKELVLQLKR